MRRLLVLMVLAAAACSPQDQGSALLITGADGSVIISRDGVVTEISAALDGTSQFPAQPTPSPDGTKVVYTMSNTNGGPAIAVWDDGEVWDSDFAFLPFYFSWNRDGSSFVALGNSGGEVGGALVTPATETIEPLGTARPFFFAWSPDGSRVATNRDAGQIGLLTPREGIDPVAETAVGFQAPDWLDDETLVVPLGGGSLEVSLVPQVVTRSRLVALSLEGTTRDLADIQGPVSFAVSPDRTRVAVLDGVPGELRVIDLSGAIRRWLTAMPSSPSSGALTAVRSSSPPSATRLWSRPCGAMARSGTTRHTRQQPFS